MFLLILDKTSKLKTKNSYLPSDSSNFFSDKDADNLSKNNLNIVFKTSLIILVICFNAKDKKIRVKL